MIDTPIKALAAVGLACCVYIFLKGLEWLSNLGDDEE